MPKYTQTRRFYTSSASPITQKQLNEIDELLATYTTLLTEISAPLASALNYLFNGTMYVVLFTPASSLFMAVANSLYNIHDFNLSLATEENRLGIDLAEFCNHPAITTPILAKEQIKEIKQLLQKNINVLMKHYQLFIPQAEINNNKINDINSLCTTLTILHTNIKIIKEHDWFYATLHSLVNNISKPILISQLFSLRFLPIPIIKYKIVDPLAYNLCELLLIDDIPFEDKLKLTEREARDLIKKLHQRNIYLTKKASIYRIIDYFNITLTFLLFLVSNDLGIPCEAMLPQFYFFALNRLVPAIHYSIYTLIVPKYKTLRLNQQLTNHMQTLLSALPEEVVESHFILANKDLSGSKLQINIQAFDLVSQKKCLMIVKNTLLQYGVTICDYNTSSLNIRANHNLNLDDVIAIKDSIRLKIKKADENDQLRQQIYLMAQAFRVTATIIKIKQPEGYFNFNFYLRIPDSYQNSIDANYISKIFPASNIYVDNENILDIQNAQAADPDIFKEFLEEVKAINEIDHNRIPQLEHNTSTKILYQRFLKPKPKLSPSQTKFIHEKKDIIQERIIWSDNIIYDPHDKNCTIYPFIRPENSSLPKNKFFARSCLTLADCNNNPDLFNKIQRLVTHPNEANGRQGAQGFVFEKEFVSTPQGDIRSEAKLKILGLFNDVRAYASAASAINNKGEILFSLEGIKLHAH